MIRSLSSTCRDLCPPPLIDIIDLVMQPASCDARKVMPLAILSGTGMGMGM